MTAVMRRPNLFILGAPRCGTTAMFEFLGAHPEIHPSRLKEPFYFVPRPRRRLTEEEYLALFSDATDERWLLEATPHYLSTPEAPRLIRDFAPDGRVIVMVRDPIDAIDSLHGLRRLHRRSDDDLRSALDKGRYWRLARYGEQLERVFGTFPRERTHVVVYDDFLADNDREYGRALAFLEVDEGFRPRFRTVNPSGEGRIPALQRALGSESALRAAARRVVPHSLHAAAWRSASELNLRARPRPPVDQALAARMWLELEPDVELLSTLLDRDLVSLWRPGHLP